MASRDQLRQAAAEVIQYMKSIDEISDARVAIIGGLALWMHLKEGRATQVWDHKHTHIFDICILTAQGCGLYHQHRYCAFQCEGEAPSLTQLAFCAKCDVFPLRKVWSAYTD